jgi:hypothetical protein
MSSVQALSFLLFVNENVMENLRKKLKTLKSSKIKLKNN